jgi:hypothetical protein
MANYQIQKLFDNQKKSFKIIFNDKRENHICEKITFHRCATDVMINPYNNEKDEYSSQCYSYREIKEIVVVKK